MNSIKDLNDKIWYRLLKVLYALALLIVLGGTVLICWSDASYVPFNPALLPGVTPANVGFVPDPSLGPAPAAVPSPPANFPFRFLSEAVPAILIELFLFEASRRLFYYIVLGSWRPKKHAGGAK